MTDEHADASERCPIDTRHGPTFPLGVELVPIFCGVHMGDMPPERQLYCIGIIGAVVWVLSSVILYARE
jgi:hypothetical protein